MQEVDLLVGSAWASDASKGSVFRSAIMDLESLRYSAQKRFLVLKLGPLKQFEAVPFIAQGMTVYISYMTFSMFVCVCFWSSSKLYHRL